MNFRFVELHSSFFSMLISGSIDYPS